MRSPKQKKKHNKCAHCVSTGKSQSSKPGASRFARALAPLKDDEGSGSEDRLEGTRGGSGAQFMGPSLDEDDEEGGMHHPQGPTSSEMQVCVRVRARVCVCIWKWLRRDV